MKKLSYYQRMLIDTTWRGSYLRRAHDLVVRVWILFQIPFVRKDKQNPWFQGHKRRIMWNRVKYPNPCKYQ